ncbi:MAG TPA: LamG-like jellyroll fold domain-containing protein, partial [Candidatus Paceibacterota bacterium]
MKKGFTLMEILVVVAVIVVLAVTVLFILNPITLTEQAYDATRVSDMSTLNKAISLYYADAMNNPSTMFMGTSSVIYISVPDPSATSTAGDQCQGLGLPTAPTGYTYQCAASSTYLRVDGTGWIPINFTTYLSGKSGSVISKLPVDPVNQTSSGLYYTYNTDGGSNYEVTSIFESQKYKAQYATNVLDPDYPEVDAKGSSLSLSPLFNPTGLVGWWPLNEGSGTTAYDQSGSGNNGTWSGNPPYYTAGKVGSYAGNFDGSTDYVSSNTNGKTLFSNQVFSATFWINPANNNSMDILERFAWCMGGGPGGFGIARTNSGTNLQVTLSGGAGPTWSQPNFTASMPINTWTYIAVVASGTSATAYDDGVSLGTQTVNAVWTDSTEPFS